MSRNSCLTDLKAVKRTCYQYQLEVQFERSRGYFLIGSQFQIRKLFVDTFDYQTSSELSNEMTAIWTDFDPDLYDLVKHCARLVSHFQKNLKLQLTSEASSQLSCQLAYSIHRVRLGLIVSLSTDEKGALKSSQAFQGASLIVDELSNEFNLTIPEDEVCYTTILLLSLRNHSVRQLGTIDDIHAIVRKMVIDFQRFSCIEFDNQRALPTPIHAQQSFSSGWVIVFSSFFCFYITDILCRQNEKIAGFVRHLVGFVEIGVFRQRKNLSSYETRTQATYFDF